MWEQIVILFLPAVVGALRLALQNHPDQLKKYSHVIADAAQVSTQADTITNGAIWAYTAPPALTP